jgi:hypothetical protein
MPHDTDVHRNGRIRVVAVLAILLTVGVTAGWRSLMGWPALVLTLDLAVTGVLLTRLRSVGPPRRRA